MFLGRRGRMEKKKVVEVKIDVVNRLADKIFEDVDEVRMETGEVITIAEVIHAFGYYLFESGKAIESGARTNKAMKGFIPGGGAG